jgi:hypothetical protein
VSAGVSDEADFGAAGGPAGERAAGSENPEASENKENCGNRNDLVNDVLRGTGTQETFPGRRQRIRCDRLSGLHLASAYHLPCGVLTAIGRNPMVRGTMRSLLTHLTQSFFLRVQTLDAIFVAQMHDSNVNIRHAWRTGLLPSN